MVGCCSPPTSYVAFVNRLMPESKTLTNFVIQHTIFGRAPLFAWGILAAFVYERWGERIRIWGQRTTWVHAGGADILFAVLVLTMAVFLGSLMTAFDYVTLEQTHPSWHVIEGAFWATVLLFCLLAPLRVRAVMQRGGFREMGRISYSFYLPHEPILLGGVYVLRQMRPDLFGAWGVPAIGAVAALTTRCDRHPCVNARDRSCISRRCRSTLDHGPAFHPPSSPCSASRTSRIHTPDHSGSEPGPSGRP